MKSVYFSYFNSYQQPGVKAKVEGIVSAISGLGVESKNLHVEHSGFRSTVKAVHALMFTQADLVFIRAPIFFEVYFLVPLVFLRLRRVKVVVDLPTPLSSILKETTVRSDLSSAGRRVRKLLLIFFSPLFLLLASRIVVYANEEFRLPVGIRSKLLLIGNGIDVNVIPERLDNPSVGRELHIICLGVLAKWHGFDRLLNGLSVVSASTLQGCGIDRIVVHIVGDGDGDVLKHYRSIVSELHDAVGVEFHGRLVGKELDALLSTAHLAVGSLGMHRIGLSSGSPLKVREYMARVSQSWSDTMISILIHYLSLHFVYRLMRATSISIK